MHHTPPPVPPTPAGAAPPANPRHGAAAPADLPLPRLYSVEDVCRIFDRSSRTIRAWCRAGHLSPIRVGKAVFFKTEDIDTILNGLYSMKPGCSKYQNSM